MVEPGLLTAVAEVGDMVMATVVTWPIQNTNTTNKGSYAPICQICKQINHCFGFATSLNLSFQGKQPQHKLHEMATHKQQEPLA